MAQWFKAIFITVVAFLIGMFITSALAMLSEIDINMINRSSYFLGVVFGIVATITIVSAYSLND